MLSSSLSQPSFKTRGDEGGGIGSGSGGCGCRGDRGDRGEFKRWAISRSSTTPASNRHFALSYHGSFNRTKSTYPFAVVVEALGSGGAVVQETPARTVWPRRTPIVKWQSVECALAAN